MPDNWKAFRQRVKQGRLLAERVWEPTTNSFVNNHEPPRPQQPENVNSITPQFHIHAKAPPPPPPASSAGPTNSVEWEADLFHTANLYRQNVQPSTQRYDATRDSLDAAPLETPYEEEEFPDIQDLRVAEVILVCGFLRTDSPPTSTPFP